MATPSAPPPPQKLARVQVTVSRVTDDNETYVLAEEKDVKNEAAIRTYRAFWIEWKVENGLTIQSATQLTGGEIRGFVEAKDGRHAEALVVLTAEHFTYRLCVDTGTPGPGGSTRLAHGGLPTDGAARLTCTAASIQDPQPPPKVIGPAPFAADDTGGEEGREGRANGVIVVPVREETWTGTDENGEQVTVPYFVAQQRMRPPGPDTLGVRFAPLPAGYEVVGVEPEVGGRRLQGSGTTLSGEKYDVLIAFDDSKECEYILTLKERRKGGGTCWVYGGAPRQRPSCGHDGGKEAGGPQPPPVIIGGP